MVAQCLRNTGTNPKVSLVPQILMELKLLDAVVRYAGPARLAVFPVSQRFCTTRHYISRAELEIATKSSTKFPVMKLIETFIALRYHNHS